MNRSGFALVGMAVAILGWAVMYTALTGLNPKLSPTGKSVGIGDSLMPGKLAACGRLSKGV